MDKIDMSLDDIIKQNRKQKKSQQRPKPARGRGRGAGGIRGTGARGRGGRGRVAVGRGRGRGQTGGVTRRGGVVARGRGRGRGGNFQGRRPGALVAAGNRQQAFKKFGGVKREPVNPLLRVANQRKTQARNLLTTKNKQARQNLMDTRRSFQTVQSTGGGWRQQGGRGRGRGQGRGQRGRGGQWGTRGRGQQNRQRSWSDSEDLMTVSFHTQAQQPYRLTSPMQLRRNTFKNRGLTIDEKFEQLANLKRQQYAVQQELGLNFSGRGRGARGRGQGRGRGRGRGQGRGRGRGRGSGRTVVMV